MGLPFSLFPVNWVSSCCNRLPASASAVGSPCSTLLLDVIHNILPTSFALAVTLIPSFYCTEDPVLALFSTSSWSESELLLCPHWEWEAVLSRGATASRQTFGTYFSVWFACWAVFWQKHLYFDWFKSVLWPNGTPTLLVIAHWVSPLVQRIMNISVLSCSSSIFVN